MSHSEYLQSVRAQACQVAEDVLAGRLCVLDASHSLVGLLWEAKFPESDEAFLALRWVSSDIDHLPLGSVRQYWAPKALAELQPQIESTREWATPTVLDACRALVQRLKA